MLAVIEGVDGSGKQTQSQLLYEKLKDKFEVLRLTFPNYESDTSALVKMYLGGEFGSKPEDVNAYASSSFYAVDRIGGFLKDWKADYDGKIRHYFSRLSQCNGNSIYWFCSRSKFLLRRPRTFALH